MFDIFRNMFGMNKNEEISQKAKKNHKELGDFLEEPIRYVDRNSDTLDSLLQLMRSASDKSAIRIIEPNKGIKMNTPLTIEALREMELPVRLKCKYSNECIEVLFIGNHRFLYSDDGVERSAHNDWLKEYQLATKTKTITHRNLLNIDGAGQVYMDDDCNELDMVTLNVKYIINEETGEIISREVSAE